MANFCGLLQRVKFSGALYFSMSSASSFLVSPLKENTAHSRFLRIHKLKHCSPSSANLKFLTFESDGPDARGMAVNPSRAFSIAPGCVAVN